MTSDKKLNQQFVKRRECANCNIVSKDVFRSERFKKALCLDCLKEEMLQQQSEHNG